VQIQVTGHQPREYPGLGVVYLPDKSQLLVISSNGVSLIAVPGGERLKFWQTGSGKDPSPWFVHSPNDETVLAVLNGEGIYLIPTGP
jgi:hypothetical protein